VRCPGAPASALPVLLDFLTAAGLVHLAAGILFFAVWTSLVAAYLCCHLGLWRVTADQNSVHMRRGPTA
jgi:hypothetical protein